MRIIAAADLHGSLPHYTALARFVEAQQPDALVLAGDLLEPTTDPRSAIPDQRRFLRALLRPWLYRLSILVPGIRILAVPGNWEYASHEPDLLRLHERNAWSWLDRRVAWLAPGRWIAGLGDVPLSPLAPKDRERPDTGDSQTLLPADAVISDGDTLRAANAEEVLSRATLADQLASLARRSDPASTIYVLHAPPWNTALDQIANRTHVGSRAVRSFIESYQPPLTIHGHIHESPAISGAAITRLGRTWAINPGQQPDALCVAVFDLYAPGDTFEHHIVPFVAGASYEHHHSHRARARDPRLAR